MIRVKICGVTTLEDARHALDCGADALGFNFVPGTPRCLDEAAAAVITSALSAGVERVGVFVNETPGRVEAIARRAGLSAVQLHGEESPEMCRQLLERGFRVIRGLRVRGPEIIEEAALYPDCTVLLDAYVKGEPGGTGQTFDWSLAREIAAGREVFLSGGLRPENVADAVRRVKPYGVDSSSGVEGDVPGWKDPDRVKAFIESAREADRALMNG
jgi:phosphoribosylanthranilate isomerase